MPTIPRRAIDEYTRGVNAASRSAAELLLSELDGIDWDMPIGDLRDLLVEIMQACCESASNVSAVVAAEFYDAAREHAIGSGIGATAEAGYSPRGVEGAVRAFVQDVVDGRPDAPERIARRCVERVDYEAKRAAASSIKANARRDRARPRYARVPSGSETCEFCLMLASRGPVYQSADGAGEGNHFHANCDCRIVPVWDSHREVTDAGGVVRRGGTQIEGYDPDAYYERYVRAMLDPDFKAKVRASAEKASGERVSWSGKFARQKMLNNLSNWRESFAKARSMDELQAMVSDVSAFLDESGMGRAMTHAQWEVLRSNLRAAKRRLEESADIVFPDSVGADIYRDEVRIPAKVTGLSHDIYTQIARHSRITGRKRIAGAGTNTPIHSELDSLKDEYPEVDRHLWEKWAGNGVVEDLGIERRAHLHWYWSEQTGRVRMKVDHFLR